MSDLPFRYAGLGDVKKTGLSVQSAAARFTAGIWMGRCMACLLSGLRRRQGNGDKERRIFSNRLNIISTAEEFFQGLLAIPNDASAHAT